MGLRMLNQRQIEAFRAVMVSGGITTAAAAMRISQPAVSRLIRDLEARIGVTLFERRAGGRLRATADAAALFQDVERYFIGLEQIDQSAAGLRRRSRGTLRVASLPALYVDLLPRFIGRFLAQRPDLDIELIGNSSEATIELVSSGRCDIGFVDSPFDHPRLRREELAGVSAVAVVPAAHPLAGNQMLAPSDFEGNPFVSIARATQLRTRIDAFFLSQGVRRQLGPETPLSLIACSLVAAGGGLAIVDPFTAAAVRDPAVCFKSLDPRIEVSFSLVTTQNTHLSGPAQDFIAGIQREFAQLV
ncbi:LysR substrate-binding domain-containing protein [uncultured Bosea sp.]|uniref:LysR substrate-binding domain-containing protein n=1 Tax=uncultured Bosea sp. TaxID=211457 RepID=UPI0025FB5C74|nr:LysR substrate-binding domain-containing protein [uncultured Bosea sp.]